MFGQVELYENHIEGAKELLKRRSKKLPQVITEKFKTIFDWSYEDTQVINYKSGEVIKFPIAI